MAGRPSRSLACHSLSQRTLNHHVATLPNGATCSGPFGSQVRISHTGATRDICPYRGRVIFGASRSWRPTAYREVAGLKLNSAARFWSLAARGRRSKSTHEARSGTAGPGQRGVSAAHTPRGRPSEGARHESWRGWHCVSTGIEAKPQCYALLGT